MLVDSTLVPETIISPRSFVGLMSVYESNYLRLLSVIPELAQLDGCFRSRVAGDCALHVDVLERTRYTVTMSMTYYFHSEDGRIADPDMIIRAYLDCRLAEAMSLGSSHRHVEFCRLVREHRKELNSRWRRNIVLNKWLDYLRDQGHLILER